MVHNHNYLKWHSELNGARVDTRTRDRKKIDEAKESIRFATGIDVEVDVRVLDSVRKAADEAEEIDL